MDQVKVALAVVKKYHFWILSVVVLITGAVVWQMASSALARAFEADKGKIEAATKSLDPFGGEPPNASFKQKVDQMHDALKQDVAVVWKELYEKQVGLFVWPDLIAPDIAKLQPGEPIPPRLLAFYNNNIVRDEWHRVLEEIDLRRPKVDEENAGGAPGGMFGGNANANLEGLVVWDEAAREAIVNRYYSESPPSDLKVRLTQEDLWIFEHSLIPVVNLVNASAHDAADATIKRIEVLDLAQWAINAANESNFALYKPGSGKPGRGGGMMGGGMAGMGGMPGGPGGVSEGMMPGGAPGGPGGAPGAPGESGAAAGGAGAAGSGDAALIDNRYLDDQGKPLKGEPPYSEFKQMFVYMRFIMNQRKLPDLLAACANVPLPIETRQVRIHVSDPTGGASQGGAAGGPMGMMGGMMPGMEMGGMPGGGMPGGGMGGFRPPVVMGGGMGGFGGMGGGGQSLPIEAGPFDAQVELSGVVYLYNAPDIAKLGSKAPAARSFSVPKGKVAAPGGGAQGGMNMMNYQPGGAPGGPTP